MRWVISLGGGGLVRRHLRWRGCRRSHLAAASPEPRALAPTARVRSRGGVLDHAFTPDTVCDGLRGTLAAPNFALLQAAGA